MTRDEIRDEIIKMTNPYILCEMPTGIGKSRVAIELMVERRIQPSKVLIVVPRLVLIDTWKDEFDKWGHSEYKNATFVTYVSFPKKAGMWNMVIFDECHHLSIRCQDCLYAFNIKNAIFLSATVKRDFKFNIKAYFPDIAMYKLNVKDATSEGILPDPKVILIPLFLKNSPADYKIIRNKGKGNSITIQYNQRWKYKGYKGQIIINCSQREYYVDMSSLIDFYRRKSFGNKAMKNIFLHKSGERLKWLSDQKTQFVWTLLQKLSKERTLTFCNGILQTEALGTYCVNSKNKQSEKNLETFNEGKINHITACNMLDEGVNLTNCRVGVYATLNSSDRMIVQKMGRLLRHPNPIIIIPYFKFTRDEEIVQKMCENYNKDLITTIKDLSELAL